MQKLANEGNTHAARAAQCEDLLGNLYSRLVRIRTDVSEQSEFAKSDEIRDVSKEFATLVDDLLEFLAAGAKEIISMKEGGGDGSYNNLSEQNNTIVNNNNIPATTDVNNTNIPVNNGATQVGENISNNVPETQSANPEQLANYVSNLYNTLYTATPQQYATVPTTTATGEIINYNNTTPAADYTNAWPGYYDPNAVAPNNNIIDNNNPANNIINYQNINAQMYTPQDASFYQTQPYDRYHYLYYILFYVILFCAIFPSYYYYHFGLFY